MTDACYNMDTDGILLQEVFRMDNKSENEILNDDWLEKVSGGFSFEHSCPKCLRSVWAILHMRCMWSGIETGRIRMI